MKEEQYVTIGTKVLSKDIFRNVLRPLDNYSFKPNGGLWSSVHYKYMVSEWLDYVLTSHQSLLYYKNMTIASIFTLKDTANILKIDTPQQIKELAKKYPSYHHILGYYSNLTPQEAIFDFETVSKDYDGIYLNYYGTVLFEKIETFTSWSINTLLLFNLDCIKSYKNFDITLPYTIEEFPTIQNESEELVIKDQSDIYKYLYSYTRSIFNNLMPNLSSITDYNNFMEIIEEIGNKCIELLPKEKQTETKEFYTKLKKEQIQLPENIIIRNIILNYLTEYLSNNKEEINNLPKSLVKSKKHYKL